MRDKDRLAILDESPFGLMRRIGAEMERLFQPVELVRRVTLAPPTSTVDWLPAIEVLQKPDALFVRAELPGLTKEEVKIEVAEGYLTLEGERKQEKVDKRDGFLRTERSYGTFFRAIALPDGAAPDKAKATFVKGILEIEVPVVAAKPVATRRLPIEEMEEKKVLVNA
jgi:HSP20 family protein